jgi:hypothetical protein
MTNKQVTALAFMRSEVARRELVAAIKMHFRNDDVLAIHMVGRAALGLIRDLLKHRSKDIRNEIQACGWYELLKAYTAGTLPKIFTQDESFQDWIKSLPASKLETITISDWSKVKYETKGPSSNRYWRQFDKIGNLLKHTGRDPRSLIDPDKIDNDELLMYCCAGYGQLGLPPTMETFVFKLYWHSVYCDNYNYGITDRELKLVQSLKAHDGQKRKAACRFLIGDNLQ